MSGIGSINYSSSDFLEMICNNVNYFVYLYYKI